MLYWCTSPKRYGSGLSSRSLSASLVLFDSKSNKLACAVILRASPPAAALLVAPAIRRWHWHEWTTVFDGGLKIYLQIPAWSLKEFQDALHKSIQSSQTANDFMQHVDGLWTRRQLESCQRTTGPSDDKQLHGWWPGHIWKWRLACQRRQSWSRLALLLEKWNGAWVRVP